MTTLNLLGCQRAFRGLLAALLAGSLTSCTRAGSGTAAEPLPLGPEACAVVRAATHGASGFPAGTSVKVATAFSSEEAQRFERSLEVFESCSGIDVVQEATDMLESRLRAIDPGVVTPSWRTDLAVVPQPGLAQDLARQGVTVPLPRTVRGNVELGWDRTWAEVAEVEGEPYAAPLLASVKSFVWYSPQAFAEAGYRVPASWRELLDLTAQIKADHPGGEVTPWCLGVEDGGASGWTLSDWLEEVLLTTQGSSAYDRWARHEVPLDDPSAVKALKEVESLVLAEGHVPGGRTGARHTTLEAAGESLAQGRCLMLHASSAYETILPAGTAVLSAAGSGAGQVQGQSTLDAFPFPVTAPDDPVLVGGDYLVRVASPFGTEDVAEAVAAPSGTSHAEAVTAVMDYLTSADWARRRVALGGVTTGNRAVTPDSVDSAVGQRAIKTLQSRQVAIRFDASDAMPSSVGTAALWTALVAWNEGSWSAEQALQEAESSWPQD